MNGFLAFHHSTGTTVVKSEIIQVVIKVCAVPVGYKLVPGTLYVHSVPGTSK